MKTPKSNTIPLVPVNDRLVAGLAMKSNKRGGIGISAPNWMIGQFFGKSAEEIATAAESGALTVSFSAVEVTYSLGDQSLRLPLIRSDDGPQIGAASKR